MVKSMEMESLGSVEQESSHGIGVKGAEPKADTVDSVSSSSCSEFSSVESDLSEEVTSSAPSSPPLSPSGSSADQPATGPLNGMSSLLQQLPFKRGLSRHYQGKSQSFTSLSNVTCLEDLAKPENPYNKKLKSCRSYVGLSTSSAETQKGSPPRRTLPRPLSKKAARGCCSSISAKRNGLGTARPPIPAHRSNSTSGISGRTVLFA